MAERVSARTRRFVAERADLSCEYCLTPAGLTPSPYCVEHIQPRSKGGDNVHENLAFSCQGCNGHKGNRTTALDPATRQNVSLFNPRREKWEEHFGWAFDATKIQGRTPTGRATVITMNLNRPGLQNLRRLMVLADLHPGR